MNITTHSLKLDDDDQEKDSNLNFPGDISLRGCFNHLNYLALLRELDSNQRPSGYEPDNLTADIPRHT